MEHTTDIPEIRENLAEQIEDYILATWPWIRNAALDMLNNELEFRKEELEEIKEMIEDDNLFKDKDQTVDFFERCITTIDSQEIIGDDQIEEWHKDFKGNYEEKVSVLIHILELVSKM